MNKFEFSNNCYPDQDMFPKNPATMSVYFYDDPNFCMSNRYLTKDDVSAAKEISMDVCDSAYAILSIDQYYEWSKKFDDICKNDSDVGDQLMALKMSWPLADGHFTMVIDEGYLTDLFAEYCSFHDIDCQFHIDNPDCHTDSYDYVDYDVTGEELNSQKCWASDKWVEEHVYTGAGEDFPYLVRALHNIQEDK